MATIIQNFSIAAGSLGPVGFTSTGTQGIDIGTVAAANSNTQYNIALDVSVMNSIFLYADGNLAVTTNAQNGSGGQNFALTAGVPFFWNDTSGVTNPLNTDVVDFWWHNATNAAINVYGLVNQTPI